MPANYEIVGDRDRPWLVMVHGMSQDRRVFGAQVEAFKSTHRIQLIDLPGHGLSADIPGPYGHLELMNAVRGAMDAAGIARCHYWATHTGTSLGLLMATADPNRFESLVLEGAVVPGHTLPSVDRELQRIRETAQRDGIAAARRRWFDEAAWFDVMRTDPVACRADAHRAIVMEFSGAPWLYDGQAAPVAPIDDQLAALDVRVLIYNGEHDLDDFIASADFLETTLPKVSRLSVPDAGGFPAWEYPERVNAAVAALLERL